MTDNEPVENRPDAEDQAVVTPLLDVLSGADEPDAGRHALARPVPTPPGADEFAAEPATGADEPALAEPVAEPAPGFAPAPGPAMAQTTGSDPAVFSTGALPTGALTAPYQPGLTDQPAAASYSAPVPVVSAPVPAAVPPAVTSQYGDLDPHPPTKAGWGTHVLGVLVGLVVGPVGAVALLLGQSRILAVQTDRWDADVDVFGIALVVVSALVLVALVLLAAWTASAPLTGGVVTAALGGWALAAPGSFSDVMGVDSGTWKDTVEQTVVAATSGTLLTVGLLLLGAGIAAVVVRRAGVRLGVFLGRGR